MIELVKIEGFQSHVNSSFYLGGGLNVITGPSDAGKTAILRAVRWVAFNEPTGEAYVNESVGEALVTIKLATGQLITKHRRKGKTKYVIQPSEAEEGSVFEKSEVPVEVKALLGIEKTSFGDFESALNFSFQLDAPFLISETASAGAKVLGKLAGTESVDLAIKGVSKDTYAARQERQQADKDIERITASLFEYHDIDNAKEAVDVAEQLIEKIEALHKQGEDLKQYRHLYELQLDKIAEVEKKLDTLAIVPDLEEDLKNVEKAQQRYDLLLDLYRRLFSVESRLGELNHELGNYQSVTEAAEIAEVITKEEQQLTALLSLSKEYQNYTDVVNKAAATLEKTVDLNPIGGEIVKLESLRIPEIEDLQILKVEYRNAEKRYRSTQERFTDFQDLGEATDLLNVTASIYDDLATLKNLQIDFKHENEKLSEAVQRAADADTYVYQAQHNLSKAWEEAGGICPLCEQPLEGGHSHA